jgi:Icc-related predicted phosphoesterase
MKIGFVGDIHAKVFHALAVLTAWQMRNQCKLDLIFQVGDLGAYPYPDKELKNDKYVRKDLTELDFSRYLQAKGRLAENIQYIRTYHLEPIYFIRGNHEDFTWLRTKSYLAKNGTICVDPFDLLYYAVDGSIMEQNNLSIAFLGGIQTVRNGEESIDEAAYYTLLKSTNKRIDILITHDAPFGIGTGYDGNIQGSTMISTLIKQVQPN